jgi:hypothetical protein
VHKTPILPLSFAKPTTFMVPATWDISRFESVLGLYDQPVRRWQIVSWRCAFLQIGHKCKRPLPDFVTLATILQPLGCHAQNACGALIYEGDKQWTWIQVISPSQSTPPNPNSMRCWHINNIYCTCWSCHSAQTEQWPTWPQICTACTNACTVCVVYFRRVGTP